MAADQSAASARIVYLFTGSGVSSRMTQTIDKTSPSTAVGKPMRRQDALDKLTGRTRYAGVINIDISAALEVAGVRFVYTAATLGMAHYNGSSRTMSPLAREEVLWCGQPVAIVLAESEAAAEDGAGAVDVEYEHLPAVIDPLAAMQPGSPLTRVVQQEVKSEIAGGGAHAAVSEEEEQAEEQAAEAREELSPNVSDKGRLRLGNMAQGWREAEVVVERTFETSMVHQSYLEPQSIVVVPDPLRKRLTIW